MRVAECLCLRSKDATKPADNSMQVSKAVVAQNTDEETLKAKMKAMMVGQHAVFLYCYWSKAVSSAYVMHIAT